MYSYKSWSYFNFEYVPSLLNIWNLVDFLCFCALLFLLDHIDNYVLVIDKGAHTDVEVEGFPGWFWGNGV